MKKTSTVNVLLCESHSRSGSSENLNKDPGGAVAAVAAFIPPLPGLAVGRKEEGGI